VKLVNHHLHRSFNRKYGILKYKGVASIEYALIAALIAVAIIIALQAASVVNGGIWSDWTSKFIAAVNTAINQ
jgi:Flp pilus assembly pilin Flp